MKHVREGYKETEVGVIPEDWEVKEFDELYVKESNKAKQINKTEYQEKGTIPIIDQGQDVIAGYTEDESKRIVNNQGYIVFGDHTRIVKYIDVDFALGADGTHLLRGKTPNDNKFTYYSLASKEIKSLGYSRHFKLIKEMKFSVPPLPEQQKITEILSSVDEQIEAVDEQIAATKELKKGLMQKLLTKGIGHTKFKQTELGEIPESWEIKILGEIGDFLKGKGIAKKDVIDIGLPCIRYGEIYTTHNFIIKEFKSFISKETAESSTKIIFNDILFAGSGETVKDIGKSVVYLGNFDAYAGGDIIILRCSQELNGKLLSYMLNSANTRKQLIELGQGNAVVHIYASSLEKVLIALPPLQEQKKIADILSAVDEQIEVKEAKKNELQELKKGLMQKLLTGEIRVS